MFFFLLSKSTDFSFKLPNADGSDDRSYGIKVTREIGGRWLLMIALRTRDGAEPLSVRGLVLVCRTVLPRTAASQSAVPQKAVVEKSKTIMFVDTRVASNKGRYAVGARYPSGPQPPKRPEIEIGGEDATRTQRVGVKNLYFVDEEKEIVHHGSNF